MDRQRSVAWMLTKEKFRKTVGKVWAVGKGSKSGGDIGEWRTRLEEVIVEDRCRDLVLGREGVGP